MAHALTIDVEDYFQVEAFANVVDYASWDQWPRRVVDNTRRVMDIVDEAGQQATFFVLGWVADREPALVREIAERGHEVACHGYSHRLVYRQTPETFRRETIDSKKLLEDLVGRPVVGYRAASYSIVDASRWALEILIEAGFQYDSSIFPIHHDNYGMPDAPTTPHWIRGDAGDLLEFPLTTRRMSGLNVPVAGGGYFRLYPYSLTRWLLRGHERERDDPFIFYLHPWEVDPAQPRVPDASLKSRFRHYLNLDYCAPRLSRLLSEFSFTTMGQLAERYRAQGDLPDHRYAA